MIFQGAVIGALVYSEESSTPNKENGWHCWQHTWGWSGPCRRDENGAFLDLSAFWNMFVCESGGVAAAVMQQFLGLCF